MFVAQASPLRQMCPVMTGLPLLLSCMVAYKPPASNSASGVPCSTNVPSSNTKIRLHRGAGEAMTDHQGARSSAMNGCQFFRLSVHRGQTIVQQKNVRLFTNALAMLTRCFWPPSN